MDGRRWACLTFEARSNLLLREAQIGDALEYEEKDPLMELKTFLRMEMAMF